MFFNKIKQLLSKPKKQDICNQNIHTDIDADQEEVLGSVTYYVKKDSDDIFLDLFLSDYTEESIHKFAKILSGIASIRVQLQTIEMLRSCFDEQDEDIFNKIIYLVIEETNKEVESLKSGSQYSDQKESQPWIKPSEIIK